MLYLWPNKPIMRLFLTVFMLAFSLTVCSQDLMLARKYVDEGAYEKAEVYYKRLVEQNPARLDYVLGLIEVWQQLENYEAVNEHLHKLLKKKRLYPSLMVELGYNYALQKEHFLADKYYKMALAKVEENVGFANSIAIQFHKHALLDEAIEAYEIAMKKKPELNYHYQLARIYGEKGALELMYKSYLELLWARPDIMTEVKRNLGDFITEQSANESNILLKKLLLKKAQSNPDVLWNELLSWLFVQQQQYRSALAQEKAVYTRSAISNLSRIENLGRIALEEGHDDAATAAYEFIISQTNDLGKIARAHEKLNRIKLKTAGSKDFLKLERHFQSLFEEYGLTEKTLPLQTQYARFTAFEKNQPLEAASFLKKRLPGLKSKYNIARLKLTLADILVYAERFNQALIYYSQVQKKLKNDVMGQNARYKVARASFYKGDFDWAHTQLKVLRSSTSQLIANDAMKLSLLISDNSLEDSTHTALKKYARADLLAFQNKIGQAINLLDDILENHKGEKIEDETLFMQAQLFEKIKNYDNARLNYRKMITFYPDDILTDDAHFYLAGLYLNHLNDIEKAKEHYEKIIFNHPDSIFFVEARKIYRRLRGDVIN